MLNVHYYFASAGKREQNDPGKKITSLKKKYKKLVMSNVSRETAKAKCLLAPNRTSSVTNFNHMLYPLENKCLTLGFNGLSYLKHFANTVLCREKSRGSMTVEHGISEAIMEYHLL